MVTFPAWPSIGRVQIRGRRLLHWPQLSTRLTTPRLYQLTHTSSAVATMNAPPLPTLDRATSKSATQQVKPPSGFRPSLQLTAGQADTCPGASVNPFSTGSAANRSSSRRSLLKEAVRRSQALSASDAAEHITSQPDRDPSRGPPKSGSTGVWCGESSTQQLAVPSLSGASSDGGSGLSSSAISDGVCDPTAACSHRSLQPPPPPTVPNLCR
ncbi:unnamed protein product [Arctogadus glacialis]